MSEQKNIKVIASILLAAVMLLTGGLSAKAQDVSFSQTYEAPLYLSPSFTGFTNGTRIGLNYRNQWPGIGAVYQNYMIGVDNFFNQFSSGVGFTWVCDNQGKGLLKDNEFGLLYAYEFPINKYLFLRPGLSFKFGQRSIDRSKMVTYTDITADGSFATGGSSIEFERTRKTRIDAAASCMVYNDDFWAGISIDHLVQPDVSFTDVKDRLKLKYTVFAGYRLTYEPSYRGSDPKTVTLSVSYMHQYSYNQLEVGVFWYYMPIEVGVSWRGLFVPLQGSLYNRDAVIPSLGVNIGAFRLGYSYDLTVSKLASFGNGAHEASLIYRFIPSDVKKRQYKMKPVPCSEPIMGYSYSGSGRSKSRVPRMGIGRRR